MAEHGTAAGYTNDRCRCELCRRAWRDAARRRRAGVTVTVTGDEDGYRVTVTRGHVYFADQADAERHAETIRAAVDDAMRCADAERHAERIRSAIAEAMRDGDADAIRRAIADAMREAERLADA